MQPKFARKHACASTHARTHAHTHTHKQTHAHTHLQRGLASGVCGTAGMDRHRRAPTASCCRLCCRKMPQRSWSWRRCSTIITPSLLSIPSVSPKSLRVGGIPVFVCAVFMRPCVLRLYPHLIYINVCVCVCVCMYIYTRTYLYKCK